MTSPGYFPELPPYILTEQPSWLLHAIHHSDMYSPVLLVTRPPVNRKSTIRFLPLRSQLFSPFVFFVFVAINQCLNFEFLYTFLSHFLMIVMERQRDRDRRKKKKWDTFINYQIVWTFRSRREDNLSSRGRALVIWLDSVTHTQSFCYTIKTLTVNSAIFGTRNFPLFFCSGWYSVLVFTITWNVQPVLACTETWLFCSFF